MAITLANYNATVEFDMSKFKSGMNQSSKDFQSYKKSIQDSATKLGASITKTLTAASGAAIAAGTYAVSEASKYESSLAKLSTIADTSQVSMKDLGGALKDLSNDTGVAASELANVAYNAISAGTDTKNAVEMAETATKLAVGGFTDADSALSVLTTALNAYGESAGTATEISDSLIEVQNRGVTTVSDLSSSIGKAIAMGAGYGVSLHNIESGYISLTKQGISTAESTTYMNSMIKELGKSSSGVSKILQEKTGKSFGELMESGMSLGDVIGILHESVDGNSEAFNQLWRRAEAGMAASAIVNNGLDAFNENLEALENSSGATEAAYSKMSDTLEHKMGVLKTNIANLASSIGQEIIPYISKFVEKGTEWVQKFSEMDESTKQTIVKVGGFIAALGPVVLIVTKVGGAIGGTIKNISTLSKGIGALITESGGLSGLFAKVGAAIGGVAAPVLAVIAVIGLLGAAFVTLWNNNEEFRNKITSIWNGIKTTVQNFIAEIKIKLESVGITFESVTTVLKTIWDGFCQVMAPVFEGAFQAISTILSTVLGVLSGLLSVFIGIFTGDWSQVWDGAKQIFDSVWNGISGLFENVINTIKSVADVFFGWFGGSWEGTWNTASSVFMGVWNGISGFFSGISKGIQGITNTLFGSVKQKAATSSNQTKSTVSKAWTGLKQGISTTGKAIGNVAKSAFTVIKNTASKLSDGAKTAASKAWTGIKTNVTNAANGAKKGATAALNGLKSGTSTITNGIKTTTTKGWNNIKTGVSKTVTSLRTSVQNTFKNLRSSLNTTTNAIKTSTNTSFQNLKSSTVKTVNALKSSMVNVFKALVSSIKSTVSSLKSSTVSIFNAMKSSLISAANSAKSSIVSSFNSIKDGVSSAMRSAKDKAVSAWDGISGKFRGIGKNIVDGIKSGVSSAAGGLYSALKNLAHRALAAAKSALGIHSPSKVFKSVIGENIVKGIISGINAQSKNAKKSAKELSKLYVDASVKRMTELKKHKKISVEEEVKYWKYLLGKVKSGTDSYNKVLAKVNNAQTRLNAQKAKEAQKKAQEAQKKAQETKAKNQYNDAKKKLDALKKANKITEVGEIAYWQRIVKHIKKGTEAYKTAQAQVVAAKNKLKSDVTNLTKNYAKDIAKVEQTLASDIKNLQTTYANAVNDSKKSIMKQIGLFDTVKIEDSGKTKKRLKYDLTKQVKAYKEWNATMQSLEKRLGVNSPLLAELHEMGISSKDTLKALNSMSKKELKEYVDLYNKKSAYASSRAKAENATLLNSTNKQIANLKKTAEKQIASLTKTYETNLIKLGAKSKSKSADIGKQITAGISAGLKAGESGLSKTLKSLINKLVKQAKKHLKIKSPSGVFRDEVGQWIPRGIAQGIDEDTSVVSSLGKLGEDAIDTSRDLFNGLGDGVGFTGGLFDNLIAQGNDLINKAVNGVTAATSAGASTSNNSMVIHMGNITVSGVLDKDAAEQVRQIADEQVAQFDDALSSVIPVMSRNVR